MDNDQVWFEFADDPSLEREKVGERAEGIQFSRSGVSRSKAPVYGTLGGGDLGMFGWDGTYGFLLVWLGGLGLLEPVGDGNCNNVGRGLRGEKT